MKRKIIILFALVMTLFMTISISTQANAAGAVKLNNKKVVLEVGRTKKLRVKNTSQKAKWSTSDSSIAKVSKSGKITATGVGLATVTATVNGRQYACKVTVVDYNGMSDEQKEVIGYALKYVGNSYRYGGSSLTKGTDCSGFTMAVYNKFGYDLTHNAAGQMYETKKVNIKKIKPGDLMFYGSSKSSCNHVAMYIGNGKVVHASTERTGITISNYKYRKCVGVGRVLDTETYSDPENGTGNDVEEDNVSRYAKEK